MKNFILSVLFGFIIFFSNGEVYDCEKAEIVILENQKVIFLQIDKKDMRLIPLLAIPQEDIQVIKPY